MPLAPRFQGSFDCEVLMMPESLSPYLAVDDNLSQASPFQGIDFPELNANRLFTSSAPSPHAVGLRTRPSWALLLRLQGVSPGQLLSLLIPEGTVQREPTLLGFLTRPSALHMLRTCSGYFFHLDRPLAVSDKPAISSSSCPAFTTTEAVAQLR